MTVAIAVTILIVLMVLGLPIGFTLGITAIASLAMIVPTGVILSLLTFANYVRIAVMRLRSPGLT